jgi:hypothetical protein
MSCNLTGGFTLGCRDSVGGIKAVYITELTNKNTLSSATEGLISTFTLDTGKQFWTFELQEELSNFEDKTIGNRENGTVYNEQTLNLIFNKGEVTKRNQIKLIARNKVMVIVLDQNGIYWLLGETNGLELTEGNFTSGTAMGDRNGYAVILAGKETNPAQQVTGSLIATLTAPAS